MDKTIWKKLPYKDFDEVYEVSNKGDIRSIAREVMVYPKNLKPYTKKLKSRMCSFRTNGVGDVLFTTITIKDELKEIKKTVYPHKAVALAFIPNPDNLPVVSHKNNNYKDNSVDNLFWSSQSDVVKRTVEKYPEWKTRLVNANRKSGWLTNRRKKDDTK